MLFNILTALAQIALALTAFVIDNENISILCLPAVFALSTAQFVFNSHFTDELLSDFVHKPEKS
jgi:hypothetical protein